MPSSWAAHKNKDNYSETFGKLRCAVSLHIRSHTATAQRMLQIGSEIRRHLATVRQVLLAKETLTTTNRHLARIVRRFGMAATSSTLPSPALTAAHTLTTRRCLDPRGPRLLAPATRRPMTRKCVRSLPTYCSRKLGISPKHVNFPPDAVFRLNLIFNNRDLGPHCDYSALA